MPTYNALSFTAMPVIKNLVKKNIERYSKPQKLSWNASALEVLVDFRSVKTLEIHESVELARAEDLIDVAKVRYANVVNGDGELVGILPKQELHGRTAINKAAELRVPHANLTIDYLMVPVAKLPIVSRKQLINAKIGDVVATLHRSAQDYLLVHQEGEIIGVVPSLRIVELTGESVQVRQHASSFVDIMNAVRHREMVD